MLQWSLYSISFLRLGWYNTAVGISGGGGGKLSLFLPPSLLLPLAIIVIISRRNAIRRMILKLGLPATVVVYL